MSGTITEVLRTPGQTVAIGEAIVSISSSSSEFIVCYLPQGTGHIPEVGTSVLVRTRGGAVQRFETVVERVGAGFEQVPLPLAADPNRPQWGLPIRIALAPTQGVLPGELVDLTFR